MSIKTIVEIGSNNGSHTMNFVNEENTFVWCFEPVPILFEQLKEKFKNYNNIKIFNNAISIFESVPISFALYDLLLFRVTSSSVASFIT